MDGSKIPKLKPHFAIRAVYLVPPHCEKTNNQNSKKLTVGLASRAGQLITYENAPNMSII
ncbi:hypothetical protein LWHH1689_0608 [Limosilactobacillus reuteri]|uniref:Uncharacterized protein n=1 Tax=Limosilactobacillus reuteri TaxID=1598 RepID=A0A2S1EPX2_LIMRT|nr:hypothetical protein LWHH1689_0608 [Limosilactobacillus reuteri]